ncbi:MAG: tetratricopeptide repeat protein [Pseudomonadota bacterium]
MSPILFVVLCACHANRPVMIIPNLKSWDQKTITLCCDREAIDPECTPKHWTDVIHQHCKGTASRVPQSGASQSCARYRCDGEIRPYLFDQCSPTSERTVSIEFIVDPSFKIYSNWRERIQEAVENSNRLFQSTGIRFSLAQIRETRVLGKGYDSDAYLAEVDKLADPKVDIHVGVIGAEIHRSQFGHLSLGMSVYFGNKLVLTSDDFLGLKYTLPHELGHTFGAVHTDDYSSLMYHEEQGIPALSKIDRLSRQIMLLAKCMDFRAGVAGFDPVQAGLISDLYATILSKEDLNPLAMAYEYLGDRSCAQKDYASELKWYRQALATQPSHPYWMVNTGVAYLDTQEYQKAEVQITAAIRAARNFPFTAHIDDFGKDYHFSVENLAQFYLAVAQRHLGRLAEARTNLLTLVQQTPEYPRIYLELGRTATAAQNHKEAVSYLETFLRLVPGHKDAKALLEKERALVR